MTKTLPPGYLEFLDSRGLTTKAERARAIHQHVGDAQKLLSPLLAALKIQLVRNPTTVITRADDLPWYKYLRASKSLWEEYNYPFTSELLIRTATFEKSFDFNFPYQQITLENEEDTVTALKEFLTQLDDEFAQILCHPRLKVAALQEQMIGARFSSSEGKTIAEFGQGGIDQVRQLSEAKNVIHGTLASDLQLQIQKKENKELDLQPFRSLLQAAHLVTPLLLERLLPTDKNAKDAVLEFQIIPHERQFYLILNDFEVA